MKNLALTLAAVLISAVSFTAKAQADQPAAALGGAEISFEKEVHDYGVLKQHGDGKCEFKFTNTGTEPLIISNAKGSCGCTVPEWPREPIMPGATASIAVKYDTKRIGMINKSVTINSNAVNAPTKIIRIKGKVEAPDAGATPMKSPAGPVNH